MATIKKILAGAKSKANGQLFENLIVSCATRSGFKIIQIPLGARQFRKKLIRVVTPFDFIMFKDSKAIVLDAKSTNDKAFSYSKITPHQLENLYDVEKKGSKSGYIVYYARLGWTVFYSATQLKNLKPRESLKPKEGTLLGMLRNINLELIMSSQNLPAEIT